MQISLLLSVINREKEFGAAMGECEGMKSDARCREAIKDLFKVERPTTKWDTWEALCDLWPTMETEATQHTGMFKKLGPKGEPSKDWKKMVIRKAQLDEYTLKRFKEDERPKHSHTSKI